MDQITRPYPQFKTDVARGLQTSPFNWPGAAGWKLVNLFEESISIFWANGAPVDSVVEFIHQMHMENTKPAGYELPTKEKLELVGCKH